MIDSGRDAPGIGITIGERWGGAGLGDIEAALYACPDVLECAAPGAVFLLNAPYPPAEIWDHLPREVQQNIDMESYRIQQTSAGKIAPERRPGQRGRTRLKGERLPALGQVLADPATAWTALTVPVWYGRA